MIILHALATIIAHACAMMRPIERASNRANAQTIDQASAADRAIERPHYHTTQKAIERLSDRSAERAIRRCMKLGPNAYENQYPRNPFGAPTVARGSAVRVKSFSTWYKIDYGQCCEAFIERLRVAQTCKQDLVRLLG